MKKYRKRRIPIAVLAALFLAMPVGAEVKSGIDADSSPEYQAAMDAMQAQWEDDVAAAGSAPVVMGATAAVPVALPTPDPGGYLCMPSCAEDDARMLALAGSGYDTLAGDFIELKLIAQGTATSVEIGFFDGDTGGQWDALPLPLDFTLYADPAGDGSGTIQVGSWNSSQMIDNAWHTVSVATANNALTIDGKYAYLLAVTNPNPSTMGINVFKVRTDAVISASPQAFSFMAALRNLADAKTVYPNYPTLTPTTYDGSWVFYLQIPENAVFVELWNGDMDFGSFDLADNDTDDPNTLGAPFLPAWATGTAAAFEGVAVGKNGGTGSPPDDNVGTFFTRSPSVRYTLYAPDGTAYADTNPSGNLEWEKFRIDTAPFDASAMDYHADTIPAGLWRVEMSGVDMQNLNAWRFDYDVVANPPDELFRIGDFIWYDDNRDGVQDTGESGVSGVIVNLIDDNGAVVDTTTTSDIGIYFFDVFPGDWQTQVAPENFNAGGVLETYQPTVDYDGDGVGDDERTQTVVDTDILTYDYGYGGTGSIGDFVWHDVNGDGLQNTGEGGINGVTLTLTADLDGDGQVDMTKTDITSSDGLYLFTTLPLGDYTVTVDASNFVPGGALEGYLPTLSGAGVDPALDSNGSPTSTTLTAQNKTDLTLDFGYLAEPVLGSIGNTAWHDIDQDGFYEPGDGEQGIDGVTVRLFGDTDGDRVPDYDATMVTSGGGSYVFNDLLPGLYIVYVYDSITAPLFGGVAGVLANMEQTVDRSGENADGYNRSNGWKLNLAAGENYTWADFGYYSPPPPPPTCTGSIGDYVWNDADHDGIQDAGEPGLSGVTVKLYDANFKVLATTTTDANGKYLFTGLCAGSRYVVFETTLAYPGMVSSPDNQGSDDTRDSDGSILYVTLPADNTNDLTIDSGWYLPAPQCTGSIGDFVWNDLNRNGIQDAGEPGIDGATVNLYGDLQGINLVATMTTASGGAYLFDGLCKGLYSVDVDEGTVPAGMVPTGYNQGTDDAKDSNSDNGDPALVSLTADDTHLLTIDFGFHMPAPPPAACETGRIDRDLWTGIGGTSVANLTGQSSYPNSPSSSNFLTLLQAPTGIGDNYGTRVHGYLAPPTTGNYTFWIASDDNSELWISTDDSSANLVKRAYVNGWTNPTTWTRYTTQKSVSLYLVAGRKYYLEVLHKEGSGGDHLAVGWQTPGSSSIAVIPGSALCEDDEVPPPPPLACTTGKIDRDVWTGIGGTSVANLTGQSSYPNSPGSSGFLTLLQAPSGWADNYGTRVHGYLAPPTTGYYTFWIASDDDSELWLSSDGNSANKVKRASVSGWTNPLEWRSGSMQSASVYLEAGRKYYLEVLHKEGSGGDHLAVGWRIPGSSSTVVIPGSALCEDDEVPPPPPPTLGSIGDTVWNDSDQDGYYEPGYGEQGIDGVTVFLSGDLDGNGTMEYQTQTTTSGGGRYIFDNLSPGDYTVTVQEAGPLAGMTQTIDRSSVTGDGYNRSNPWTHLRLAAGQHYTWADFGYYDAAPPPPPPALGSIGNTVWNDSDQNGYYDPYYGEQGIDNVTVILTADLDGDGYDEFYVTTTTSNGGSYSFNSLSPGWYTVTVSQSGVLAQMTQTTDRSGAYFDDANRRNGWDVNLAAGEHYTWADFGFYDDAPPPPPPVEYGSLYGKVYYDRNWNDCWDTEGYDQLLSGVTVTLYRDNGNGYFDGGDTVTAVTTTTTGTQYSDHMENYRFDYVPLGEYFVLVSEPYGYWPSWDKDGVGTRNYAAVYLDYAGDEDFASFAYQPDWRY